MGLRGCGARRAAAVQPDEDVHRPDGHGALAFLPSTDCRTSLREESARSVSLHAVATHCAFAVGRNLASQEADFMGVYSRSSVSNNIVRRYIALWASMFTRQSFFLKRFSENFFSQCSFFEGGLGFEPEAGDSVLGKAEGAVRGGNGEALRRVPRGLAALPCADYLPGRGAVRRV